MTFRLLMMALGLAGGLFLLAPSKGPKWSEVDVAEDPAVESTG